MRSREILFQVDIFPPSSQAPKKCGEGGSVGVAGAVKPQAGYFRAVVVVVSVLWGGDVRAAARQCRCDQGAGDA